MHTLIKPNNIQINRLISIRDYNLAYWWLVSVNSFMNMNMIGCLYIDKISFRQMICKHLKYVYTLRLHAYSAWCSTLCYEMQCELISFESSKPPFRYSVWNDESWIMHRIILFLLCFFFRAGITISDVSSSVMCSLYSIKWSQCMDLSTPSSNC